MSRASAEPLVSSSKIVQTTGDTMAATCKYPMCLAVLEPKLKAAATAVATATATEVVSTASRRFAVAISEKTA